MKLSTKGRYGLRALIDLAQYSAEAPVSITSISARQDLSERYLEQLMSMLKKAGLVRSVRGAGGGYVLAKDMAEISVGDVLRALEGSLEPVECAGLEPDGECKASDHCVTKYVCRGSMTASAGPLTRSGWTSLLRKAEKSSVPDWTGRDVRIRQIQPDRKARYNLQKKES